jgi:chemotaxis protein MotB
MASEGKNLQPIIVKKIKKGGHAVHGGAWKIAYADFVTAMMAFFLLMWLLGSTSEGDKKGLSDFFNTPLKIASNSILPGGGSDLSKNTAQTKQGDEDAMRKKMEEAAAKAEVARQDSKRISSLRAKIDALITSNPKLAEYRSQIRMETTPDGLQIQIVDEQNRPMFDSGSALVKPYMRDILREIGSALSEVENHISLAGHTDSTPYGNGERGYSNWELSADRANASRRELVAAGMPDAKMARVVGLAASSLLDPKTPLAPVTRRISITIMTREAEARLLGNATIAQSVTNETSSAADAAAAKNTIPGVQKR